MMLEFLWRDGSAVNDRRLFAQSSSRSHAHVRGAGGKCDLSAGLGSGSATPCRRALDHPHFEKMRYAQRRVARIARARLAAARAMMMFRKHCSTSRTEDASSEWLGRRRRSTTATATLLRIARNDTTERYPADLRRPWSRMATLLVLVVALRSQSAVMAGWTQRSLADLTDVSAGGNLRATASSIASSS